MTGPFTRGGSGGVSPVQAIVGDVGAPTPKPSMLNLAIPHIEIAGMVVLRKLQHSLGSIFTRDLYWCQYEKQYSWKSIKCCVMSR